MIAHTQLGGAAPASTQGQRDEAEDLPPTKLSTVAHEQDTGTTVCSQELPMMNHLVNCAQN